MNVIYAVRTQILLVYVVQTLNLGITFCLKGFPVKGLRVFNTEALGFTVANCLSNGGGIPSHLLWHTAYIDTCTPEPLILHHYDLRTVDTTSPPRTRNTARAPSCDQIVSFLLDGCHSRCMPHQGSCVNLSP